MKKIIYILFLLPTLIYAQVNFSTYGATNNGTTDDDTAALQNALDNESNLIATAGATFRISSTLNIDTRSGQTINWNGATLITTTNVNPMILIDKRSINGGTTTMQNLDINGNLQATRGVTVRSRVNLTNIDAHGFRQPTSSSPVGFVLEMYNDDDARGAWVFDGCDVYDVVGASNNITTDSWGAANGFIVYWKNVPSATTTVTIKNATLHDSWGEDAGLLYFLDQTSGGNSITNSPGHIYVENVSIYDVERRNVKGFCGNVTYTNCHFKDPLPTNPNLYSSNKSGMVVFGSSGSGNILLDNCIFEGRGYDGRVIPSNTSGTVEIRNSSFIGGADLAFTGYIADFISCNNTWASGSTIYGYATQTDQGQIYIDTQDPTPTMAYSYTRSNLNCDGPPSGSGSVTGLIWNNDTQTITSGQTGDLGYTFTPLSPTNTGVSIVSSNTGILSNAGTWVSAGSATLTITADDTTNGTISDIMNVTAAAADTQPPAVLNVLIYEITENSFRVNWDLDEYSKGWVVYDTVSDVTPPYSYTYETTHENSFTWDSHNQRVGNNNGPYLTEATKYYFRIYTEDASGNSGFSDEYTATTLGEGETTPPPDEPDPGTYPWASGLKARFLKLNKF